MMNVVLFLCPPIRASLLTSFFMWLSYEEGECLKYFFGKTREKDIAIVYTALHSMHQHLRTGRERETGGLWLYF